MKHIYDGGRCIFCNSNSLDVAIFDSDEVCAMREAKPLVYSTSTGAAPSQSHGNPFDQALQSPAAGSDPRFNDRSIPTP